MELSFCNKYSKYKWKLFDTTRKKMCIAKWPLLLCKINGLFWFLLFISGKNISMDFESLWLLILSSLKIDFFSGNWKFTTMNLILKTCGPQSIPRKISCSWENGHSIRIPDHITFYFKYVNIQLTCCSLNFTVENILHPFVIQIRICERAFEMNFTRTCVLLLSNWISTLCVRMYFCLCYYHHFVNCSQSYTAFSSLTLCLSNHCITSFFSLISICALAFFFIHTKSHFTRTQFSKLFHWIAATSFFLFVTLKWNSLLCKTVMPTFNFTSYSVWVFTYPRSVKDGHICRECVQIRKRPCWESKFNLMEFYGQYAHHCSLSALLMS